MTPPRAIRVPRQPGGTFDERRNTSRVFKVPPGSVEACTAALEQWERENPAHAQWIRDGYPTLTEAEHLERFGQPHDGRTRSRQRRLG